MMKCKFINYGTLIYNVESKRTWVRKQYLGNYTLKLIFKLII